MVHILETHHCKYCDECFKTNKLLKVHRRVHFLKCTFSESCQRGFWQQDQLLDHYRRCHFLCIYCETPFFEKKTHDSHVIQHAIFCELCPKIPFWSAPDLESHKWIQHGRKCQYCEVISHSPLDAQKHFQAFHFFPCEVGCPDSFTHEDLRRSHYMAIHAFCKICCLPFVNGSALDDHIDSAHTFRCEHCPLVFRVESALEKHLDDFHTVRCEHCPLIFHVVSALEKHLDDFHTLRCEHCPLVFRVESALEKHLEDFHTIECADCDAIFPSERQLEDHVFEVHRFYCPQSNCYEAFLSNDDLLEHIELSHRIAPELDVDDDFHEWEMAGRTQCHVCLQWFLTEGRARDHLYEAHLQFDNAEAASRVECDCGNQFKDEAMLALHLKLDHHECALCRKRFSSPAALEGHRRDHVRPSPALLEVKAKPAEKVQPSNVKSPWRPPSLTVNKSKNVKTAPPSKQPSSNVSKAKNVRIEPRKFQCSYCHFSYGAERLLKRHADQKHPQCLKCPLRSFRLARSACGA